MLRRGGAGIFAGSKTARSGKTRPQEKDEKSTEGSKESGQSVWTDAISLIAKATGPDAEVTRESECPWLKQKPPGYIEGVVARAAVEYFDEYQYATNKAPAERRSLRRRCANGPALHGHPDRNLTAEWEYEIVVGYRDELVVNVAGGSTPHQEDGKGPKEWLRAMKVLPITPIVAPMERVSLTLRTSEEERPSDKRARENRATNSLFSWSQNLDQTYDRERMDFDRLWRYKIRKVSNKRDYVIAIQINETELGNMIRSGEKIPNRDFVFQWLHENSYDFYRQDDVRGIRFGDDSSDGLPSSDILEPVSISHRSKSDRETEGTWEDLLHRAGPIRRLEKVCEMAKNMPRCMDDPEISADACDNRGSILKISGLTTKLWRRQLEALNWLLNVEDNIANMTGIKTKVWPTCPKGVGEGEGICFNYELRRFYVGNDLETGCLYPKGGIYADEMGLGKTLVLLLLALSNPGSLVERTVKPLYESGYPFVNDRKKRLLSRATLVACPNQVCQVWLDEIRKHFAGSSAGAGGTLKVVAITTLSDHSKVTYGDVMDADVVIVTQNFLEPKAGYRKKDLIRPTNRGMKKTQISDRWKVRWEDADTMADEMSRDPDRVRARTSPVLETIHWHRLILDEGHEWSCKTGTDTNKDVISHINSSFRWYVTGTPFPSEESVKNKTRTKTGWTRMDSRSNVDRISRFLGLNHKYPSVDNPMMHDNEYQQVLTDTMDEHLGFGGSLVDYYRKRRKRMDAGTGSRRLPPSVDSDYVGYDYNENFFSKHIDSCPEYLHSVISTFLMWRNTNESVRDELDVPERLEVPILLEMDPIERGLYEEAKRTLNRDEKQKICSNVQLYMEAKLRTENNDRDDQNNGKTEMTNLELGKMLIGSREKDLEAQKIERIRITNRLGKLKFEFRKITSRLDRHETSQIKYLTEAGRNKRKEDTTALTRIKTDIRTNDGKMVEISKKIPALESTLNYFRGLPLLRQASDPRTDEDGERKGDEDDDTCCICLEKITTNRMVTKKCLHSFCEACIKRHIGTRGSSAMCPMCNERITVNDIIKIVMASPEMLTEIEKKKDLKKMSNKYGTKMARLLRLLGEILGARTDGRIIIFSQWDELLTKMGEILRDNGFPNSHCRGSVYQKNNAIRTFKGEIDEKKKKRKRDENDNGDEPSPDTPKIMMLSLKNSASGTNLTEATHVILMEPADSRIESSGVAMEAQAIARAHRPGRKEPLTVIRFVMKDTIEEENFNMRKETIGKIVLSEDAKLSDIPKTSNDGTTTTTTTTTFVDGGRSERRLDGKEEESEGEEEEKESKTLERMNKRRKEDPPGSDSSSDHPGCDSYESAYEDSYSDLSMDQEELEKILGRNMLGMED